MKLKGTLQHFNFSPKGGHESLQLLTSKGPVQVNFPPDHAYRLAEAGPLGAELKLEVSPWEDGRPGEHPVYALEKLKAKGGDSVKMEFSGSVKGTVVRLNYARHGEVNGAVLDTGDFVHMKPHGARLVNLSLGQKLKVTGEARPLQFQGHLVIEAAVVNGLDLEKEHHARKAAKKAAKKAARKAAAKR